MTENTRQNYGDPGTPSTSEGRCHRFGGHRHRLNGLRHRLEGCLHCLKGRCHRFKGCCYSPRGPYYHPKGRRSRRRLRGVIPVSTEAVIVPRSTVNLPKGNHHCFKGRCQLFQGAPYDAAKRAPLCCRRRCRQNDEGGPQLRKDDRVKIDIVVSNDDAHYVSPLRKVLILVSSFCINSFRTL